MALANGFRILSSRRAIAPGFGDVEIQPGLAPRPASCRALAPGFGDVEIQPGLAPRPARQRTIFPDRL